MVSHWCIGIVVSEILKFEYLHLLFTNEFFIVKLTVDFSLGNFSEETDWMLHFSVPLSLEVLIAWSFALWCIDQTLVHK